MAHVFKPTYTKLVPQGAQVVVRNGQRMARFKRRGRFIEAPIVQPKSPDDPVTCRVESETWHIRYKTAAGKWASEKGFTDEQATHRRALEIEQGIRAELRGDVDPYAVEKKRPIGEHVADFVQDLLRKNNTAQYVRDTGRNIERIIEACQFQTIADLNRTRVEEWLERERHCGADLPDEAPTNKAARSYQEIALHFGVTVHAVTLWRKQGAPIRAREKNALEAVRKWRRDRMAGCATMSIQTRNHYVTAIKQFGRWLVRERRLRDNPFAFLSLQDTKTDRRHDRRALSIEEFGRLIDAASGGPTIEGLTGPDRAMLYVLAGWTGYRRKELASLTLRSFDLDASPPSVTIEACYSKNRRRDSCPLHRVVVDRLKTWLAGKPELQGDAPLFRLRTARGHWRKTSMMMRLDLSRAGLPYRDEDGLYADFHANRHTFISNLARAGVPLIMAQKLARHSDPKLTANVYTHLQLSDKAAAIDSLPALPDSTAPRQSEGALRATGTDDQPIPTVAPPDHREPVALGPVSDGARGLRICGPEAGRDKSLDTALTWNGHSQAQNTLRRGGETPPRKDGGHKAQDVKPEGLGTRRHDQTQARATGIEPATTGCPCTCSTRTRASPTLGSVPCGIKSCMRSAATARSSPTARTAAGTRGRPRAS